MTDFAPTHASEPAPPASRPKLVDILSQDVTPQVDAAAKALIAGGDALLVKTSRTAVHGFILDQEHYDTRLEWTALNGSGGQGAGGAGGGGELQAICSCETRAAGFVCPHLWATVLLADRSGAFRALEEAHMHPIFHRNGEIADAGTEKKRRSPNAWPARPGWKIHLASIAQAAQRRAVVHPPTAAGLPRQAIYVVDATETRERCGGCGDAVIVELQSRHQKRGRGRGAPSGWTKGVAFRLAAEEIETFADVEDREILARLVGARLSPAGAEDMAVNGSASNGDSHAGGSGASINGQAHGAGGEKLCALRGAVGVALLKRMCETGRCRLRLHPLGEATPLHWDEGEPYAFLVRIAPHEEGKHFTLTGHLRRGDEVLPIAMAHLMVEPSGGTAEGLVFLGGRVARGQLNGGLQWMTLFAARGPLHVPRGDIQEFLRQVAQLPDIPPFDLPDELHFERISGVPRPRLVLRKPGRAAYAAKLEERVIGTVLFDYEAGPIDALATAAGTYDPAAHKMVIRDQAGEASALAVLKALGFRRTADPDTREAHFELPPRLLPSVVPALIREGWVVEAEGKLYRAATDFRVNITSGIDWFDLSGSMQFGDQVVPLPRLLAAARKGEHLVKLADGTFGVLPEEWLAKYGVIVQSASSVKDESGEEMLRFSKAQAGMLDVLLESQPHATVDAAFTALRTRLRSFTGVAAEPAPQAFSGQLRPYQMEGLGWFSFLREFSFGGCLADDMGLGKTIQVLALLASRAGRPGGSEGAAAGQHRPSLVVAPRSLVFNWREEALRFAPGLRILDHTGPSRTRSTEKFADVDLILTTYGTLRSDIVFLRDYKFDYAILDEAQAIKNAQTESAKAVRLLQADHRLALSGTPVQNHLGELWSLFEYLNPGMLGAAGVFDARFQPVKAKTQSTGQEAAAGEISANGGDVETAEVKSGESAASEGEGSEAESPRQLLARALRPFILRRTKEQVAQDLPPCTEQTIYCELDEAQRTMYDELRDHYRQTLLGGAPASGTVAAPQAGNRMQVLEALLRLRQAACHPGLIDKTRIAEPSAKLDTLFTQIDEIVEEGHKALVFSQFTSLLAIVRKRLDARHGGGGTKGADVRYAYLDGKTRDRKSPVEQFQNDPDTKLFLISLKAGGLGLNLTGADYVFLLDPWWNPAVEAQAIDRAHRIGQVRHVFAYRLIAKDTVEEKVLQLQQTKRDLADAIISEDNAVLSALTSDDLQILLS